MSRGQSEPLSSRIIRGLRAAGRPLTRIELSAWYVTGPKPAEVQDEIDRLVRAGELVCAGLQPPSKHNRLCDLRPQPIYAISDRAERKKNPAGAAIPTG